MLGTIVNAAAILAGGALGLLLKKGLPDRLKSAITQGVGLIVLYIGFSGALKGEKTLVATLSMVAGGLIGTALDLDGRLNRFARWLERMLVKNAAPGNTFGEGFLSATLLFCVGAMAVVGALNSGLTGDHEVLFTKSVLDGVTSIVFASALGPGVLLSAVAVFLYQGSITLLARLLSPILSAAAVAEMTCVGSLLILVIGTNMLKITDIKVMNFLPAIFLPVLFCMVA